MVSVPHRRQPGEGEDSLAVEAVDGGAHRGVPGDRGERHLHQLSEMDQEPPIWLLVESEVFVYPVLIRVAR